MGRKLVDAHLQLGILYSRNGAGTERPGLAEVHFEKALFECDKCPLDTLAERVRAIVELAVHRANLDPTAALCTFYQKGIDETLQMLVQHRTGSCDIDNTTA